MLAGGGGLQSVPRSLHVAPPGHSAVVDVHAPALHISAVVKVIPVHDWAAPQAVPFALLLPSMQSGAPVVHEIIPCLQFLVGLVVHDMPAGGRRFVQRVDGYEATLAAGIPIFERGKHTGAMPGRLVRAGHNGHR